MKTGLKVMLAMLVAVALRAAEPAPAAVKAAAVPEWANGVLTIRQFGKTTDKIGAYSNQVLPNLGELARQYVLNKVFNQIPVRAGVKADGTAFIYPLDSVLTGHEQENCFVLPVEDAAALKTSFINVMGVPSDENGVLTFSIPQPLPNPDKLQVVKFVKDNVLIAPDAELLKKLETFLTATAPEAMTGDARGDLVLTIKIERFKRGFGKILEGSMEMGAVMAANGDAKVADKLIAQMKSGLDALWQLDVVELRMSIEPKAANEKELATIFELRSRAAPGSEMEKNLSVFVPKIKGHLQRLLPRDTPFAIEFSLQGAEAAPVLKSFLVDAQLNVPDSPAAKVLLADFVPAAIKLIELGHGDGLLALLPKTGGFTTLFALDLKDEKAVPEVIDTLVAKTTRLMDTAIREDIATVGGKPNEDPLLKVKAVLPDPGQRVRSWEFDVGILDEFEKKDLARSVGWPLTVHQTIETSTLLVTKGKKSGEALAAAAAEIPKPAKEIGALPAGTCFQMTIQPISLIRTLLQVADIQMQAEGEAMTLGLKDGTITMQARIGEGSASLRWEIPSSVPAGLIPLGQRMIKSGMNPRDLLGGEKGGEVPAPPPPAP
ncbi:MAG TPA: hypothetical protein VEJ63_10160 [Planctomycetota bacterium]|nr:hypothetical protein [Planctomycetota bacterium]